MEDAEAQHFLESLLDKTLQVTSADGRLFTGTFRCTDNESNIVLSNAFEYRMPSQAAGKAVIEKLKATGQTIKADMTSRFVGLIVVPGKQIAKIEVEERREWSANLSLSLRTKT
jgi:N-alpha-acetyltransferase 38, NatC auxiliary subunit